MVESGGAAGRAALIDGRWLLSADRRALPGLVAELTRRPDRSPRRWVVSDPSDTDDVAAMDAGLRPARDVLQMRRGLPVEPEIEQRYPQVSVRAFRPGTADEEAWLSCNNRAFAGHPDQSGFTPDRLHRLMAEPWFEPAGCLLLDGEHGLAAFCWTKVHADERPALGEIFAIGVDPAYAGRGLGGSISLAGLRWLSQRGLRTAMLYVDEDNAAGRRMYDRLGFTVHHRDRVYDSDGSGPAVMPDRPPL